MKRDESPWPEGRMTGPNQAVKGYATLQARGLRPVPSLKAPGPSVSPGRGSTGNVGRRVRAARFEARNFRSTTQTGGLG